MSISLISQKLETEQFRSNNESRQKIYFIRHGQSELNIPNAQGILLNSGTSLLAGLTNEGVEQAKQLGKQIVKCIRQNEKIVVCASAAKRAQDTAKYIFEEFQKNKSLISEQEMQGYAGLNERSKGKWEGVPRTVTADQEKKWNALSAKEKIVTPELTTGESWVEVIERALPDVQKLINEHRGKTIFVVSHAATMQALSLYWNGYFMKSAEGAKSKLSGEPSSPLPKIHFENGDILSVEFHNSQQAAFEQQKNVTTHLIANLTSITSSSLKSEVLQRTSCLDLLTEKIRIFFLNIHTFWNQKAI